MEPKRSFAEIDMAKIPVSGDLAGLLFTAGSTLIWLLGVPSLRYFFVGAVVLGGAVALFLHSTRHENRVPPDILVGLK